MAATSVYQTAVQWASLALLLQALTAVHTQHPSSSLLPSHLRKRRDITDLSSKFLLGETVYSSSGKSTHPLKQQWPAINPIPAAPKPIHAARLTRAVPRRAVPLPNVVPHPSVVHPNVVPHPALPNVALRSVARRRPSVATRAALRSRDARTIAALLLRRRTVVGAAKRSPVAKKFPNAAVIVTKEDGDGFAPTKTARREGVNFIGAGDFTPLEKTLKIYYNSNRSNSYSNEINKGEDKAWQLEKSRGRRSMDQSGSFEEASFSRSGYPSEKMPVWMQEGAFVGGQEIPIQENYPQPVQRDTSRLLCPGRTRNARGQLVPDQRCLEVRNAGEKSKDAENQQRSIQRWQEQQQELNPMQQLDQKQIQLQNRLQKRRQQLQDQLQQQLMQDMQRQQGPERQLVIQREENKLPEVQRQKRLQKQRKDQTQSEQLLQEQMRQAQFKKQLQLQDQLYREQLQRQQQFPGQQQELRRQNRVQAQEKLQRQQLDLQRLQNQQLQLQPQMRRQQFQGLSRQQMLNQQQLMQQEGMQKGQDFVQGNYLMQQNMEGMQRPLEQERSVKQRRNPKQSKKPKSSQMEQQMQAIQEMQQEQFPQFPQEQELPEQQFDYMQAQAQAQAQGRQRNAKDVNILPPKTESRTDQLKVYEGKPLNEFAGDDMIGGEWIARDELGKDENEDMRRSRRVHRRLTGESEVKERVRQPQVRQTKLKSRNSKRHHRRREDKEAMQESQVQFEPSLEQEDFQIANYMMKNNRKAASPNIKTMQDYIEKYEKVHENQGSKEKKQYWSSICSGRPLFHFSSWFKVWSWCILSTAVIEGTRLPNGTLIASVFSGLFVLHLIVQ